MTISLNKNEDSLNVGGKHFVLYTDDGWNYREFKHWRDERTGRQVCVLVDVNGKNVLLPTDGTLGEAKQLEELLHPVFKGFVAPVTLSAS